MTFSLFTNCNNKDGERENAKSNKRIILAFMLLCMVLIAFLWLNICIGSVSISLKEVLEVLKNWSDESLAGIIVLNIRLPRALAACLLGGALSLSGYLLQTFFQNPIAGPFVLGISSGAKLFVAIVMITWLKLHKSITGFDLIAAAIIGSLLVTGFVIVLAGKVRNGSFLVLIGIMIGYICSAITDFVVTFAQDSDIVNLHNWSKGSFSGISWQNLTAIAVVVLPVSFLVFLLSKPMNAYRLGETYARNMGVNIKIFRILLILLSSVLSAIVTAYAGPVSFVGIAVPQLIKRLFHTAKPIIMIPACFLGGSAFCLLCDWLARCLLAPTELSISTVTAILGAPVVIIVMLKRRKEVD